MLRMSEEHKQTRLSEVYKETRQKQIWIFFLILDLRQVKLLHTESRMLGKSFAGQLASLSWILAHPLHLCSWTI